MALYQIIHPYKFLSTKLKIVLYSRLKLAKLELLSKETIKLQGSLEKVIAKGKRFENVPKLEVVA